MKFARALPTALWALLAAAAARLLWEPMGDVDLFWHLRAGRMMWETGRFPWTDQLSHTLRGAPWIDFEVLPQLFFHAAERLGGLPGVRVSVVALSLLAFACLAASARAAGARGPLLLLLGAAGFWLLRPRLMPRPEVFSWIFLASFTALVAAARRAGPFKALPWLLGGMMVLWANSHAGFVYGLFFLAAACAGSRWAGDRRETTGLLDTAFTVCLASIFINPYGVRVVHVFLETAFAVRGHMAVDEWGETTVRSAPFFWAAFIASSALVVRGILRGSRAARFWAAALVGFGVMGASAVRNAVLIVFPLLPFLASAAGEADGRNDPKAEKFLWAGALLFCAFNVWRAAVKIPPAGVLSRRNLPIGACRFVREAGIDGTMYNSYALGGYIGWALPERLVFQDSRYLFAPFLFEERDLAWFLPDSDRRRRWAAYLDRYGVDYAIYDDHMVEWVYVPGRAEPVPLFMQERMFPEKDWALVYWDDASWVFVKRVPKFAEVIRRREYRWLRPERQERMAELLRTGAADRAAVRAELARSRADAPGCVRRAFLEALL